MNRHVVVNCTKKDCLDEHRVTRFELKQLEPLPQSAREARLHIRKCAEIESSPKMTKPLMIRRPVQQPQFAH
jgi:hypothetical protein